MGTAFVLALVLAGPAQLTKHASGAESEAKQLTRLSLEELANLTVVSVSRREEGTLQAPGSVHVVTSEDIRRTGSTSIPDALRIAPGLQAARIDGDEWALAIRGFASRLSRSVLAVIDGRSVWTPLFAGVFWDAQDAMLDDVEQIEVSRGPGGANYGANAMNGVISVTTKSSKDTQGGLVALGLGTADRQAALRWGGASGERLHYRLFGKYALRDGTKALTPAGYDDEWKLGLGGFRLDWDRNAANVVTVLGNIYDGSSMQPTTIAIFDPPYSRALAGDAAFRGHSLLGRMKQSMSAGGEVTAHVYYDHTTRREPYYGENRDTFDFDLEHRFPWGGRHDLIWGADYRRSQGTFDGSPSVRLSPETRADDVAGLFVSNEGRFLDGRLRITLGTKVEWNDYSGWNAQPSTRIAWANPRHMFWGSWTRALRTSSRIERDLILYSSLSATQPLFARASGSPDFAPESVVALEGGYKLRLARVLVTASLFRNRYYDLATNVVGAPTFEGGTGGEPIRTIVPVRITNGSGGRASGFEAQGILSVRKNWRVQGAYSFLKLGLEGEAGKTFKSNSPSHQFWLTSFWTPVNKLDLDLVFRAVASIPGHQTPSYTDLDARLGFRPKEKLEFSLTGTNLFRPSRPEFGGGFAVERAVRAQAIVRF